MLGPTGPVGAAAQDLKEAFATLRLALDDFEHVAHGRIDRDDRSAAEESWLDGLRRDATTIVERAAAINRWCSWRRDRIRGEALGLGPVLAGVEAGSVGVDRVVETVRLAYARWWLAGLVDRDQTLKEFSASRHEHTIQRFRELDDRFHSLTRQYLRARIASGTPTRGGDHRGTEYAVLQRELTKMVKNLESVQGDERDVMMFSITYGPDQTGRLSMNFGPLNRQGGERRLNVAITRARSELLVFSSIGTGDIDLSRTAALGVHDLKHFLDYADRGVRALGEIIKGSMGGFESPFEAAVAEALTNRGWRVIPQVGVGGFRIDLGVVHPDEAGRFLAGIEADGATYHAGRTARDRDKLRELVLRNLGWEIIRIWSTDWWIDRRSALDAIDARLRELLQADRTRVQEERARAEEDEKRRLECAAVAALPAAEGQEADEDDRPDPDRPPVLRIARPTTPLPLSASSSRPLAQERGKYHRIQDAAERFSITEAEASAFLTAIIRPRVSEVLGGLVDAEGPVERLDVISRVAKGFGFKKAGSRIRAFVEECMPPRPETTEDDVVFLWPAGSVPGVIPFRAPATDHDIRYARDIAIEELIGLARSLPSNIAEDAAIDRMARAIGIARITAGARARLELARALRSR